MAISERRSGGFVSNIAEKQVVADKLYISNLAGARAGCLGIPVDKNPFIDETDCKRAWIGCDVMK